VSVSQSADLPWEPTAGTVEVLTDAKGGYRLEGLGAGLYELSATARGYGRARKPNVRPGSREELLLLPGPSLTGIVLDADGQPVRSALVRAESEGWRRTGSARGSRTREVCT
jgi:protocatechuate 3,4-dioxygenase beta subunit